MTINKETMNNKSNFGKFIFQYRLSKGLGLRLFCRLTGEDSANWSKIERGLLNPPKDIERLNIIAKVLDIYKDSHDYINLINLSSIQREEIPKYIITKENVMQFLPAFFKSQSGQKPTTEEIQSLINSLIGQEI